MNLEQGVNNSLIKKDSKINHVQACMFKHRLNKIAKWCIMDVNVKKKILSFHQTEAATRRIL